MIIEFQTRGLNFFYAFREKLKAVSMPLVDEQPDNQRLRIINRIVIGNDTQRRADQTANFEVRVAAPGSLTLVPGKKGADRAAGDHRARTTRRSREIGGRPSRVMPLQIWA
jgi:hypothetical protein